jgi:protein gp37
MALISTIEWTDSTWNPVTGCTVVSPGCKHCYAKTFAERFRGVPGHPYQQGFDLRFWNERLTLPLEWKEPRRIFVNSMSDLFHEQIPDRFIELVFATMIKANQHVFQVLTKRSQRLVSWTKKRYRFVNESSDKPVLPKHIWLGVSLENQTFTKRIPHLQSVPARIRFLSVEPLLGKIVLSRDLLTGIHWVIVGGESGPGARPMNPEWVRAIQIQCEKYDVPFFFKQWGAFDKNGERVGKKSAGRTLAGRTWDQMPVYLSPGIKLSRSAHSTRP